MTISTASLNLPSWVFAPEEIQLMDTPTGASDEIIVLKQLREEVFAEAHVCHLSNGQYGYGIYDMPKFRFIKIGNPSNIVTIDNTKYTMACVAENIHGECKGFALANWL